MFEQTLPVAKRNFASEVRLAMESVVQDWSDAELIDLRGLSNDPSLLQSLCRAFYDQVYRDAFPKADQSEGPEVWLPLLGEESSPPDPILHLVVALNKGAGP